MPVSSPQSGKGFRRFLTTAFCLFLAWRAVASAVTLAQEVRAYPKDALRWALWMSQEERIESALGRNYPILLTLRSTVPPDGFVLFTSERTLERALTFYTLSALLYPRRLIPVEDAPKKLHAHREKKVYFLDLRDTLRSQGPPGFDLVESGDFFRFWRREDPDRWG